MLPALVGMMMKYASLMHTTRTRGQHSMTLNRQARCTVQPSAPRSTPLANMLS